MALTTADVLTRAGQVLQDTAGTRWTSTELLYWLNDARRMMAVLRPDLFTVVTPLTLAAGAQQTLPTGVVALKGMVSCNNQSVTPVDKRVLDQWQPGWLAATQVTQPLHYMVDEASPRAFWVYPPVSAGVVLNALALTTPTDYTAGASLSAWEELMIGAIVDFVCYRAFIKDAEYAGNATRATGHYQQFLAALQTGDTVTRTQSPARRVGPKTDAGS